MLVYAFLALEIVVEASTIAHRDSDETFLIVKRVEERLDLEEALFNFSH